MERKKIIKHFNRYKPIINIDNRRLNVKISAAEVDNILKRHGYTLVMDKIHNEKELKKYEKTEKNFDRTKYLTIKDKNHLVIGRIYNINSPDDLLINKIELTENEIDVLIAFFKFFQIPQADEVARQVAKLFNIDIGKINVDIIRNNVYKQNI